MKTCILSADDQFISYIISGLLYMCNIQGQIISICALVDEWQVTPNFLAGFEEFSCAMYGRRQLKDVNVLAIHAHQGEVWVTRWVYKS